MIIFCTCDIELFCANVSLSRLGANNASIRRASEVTMLRLSTCLAPFDYESNAWKSEYEFASHKGLFPNSCSGPSQYELSCCGYPAGSSRVCPYSQADLSHIHNTNNKGAGNNEQIKKRKWPLTDAAPAIQQQRRTRSKILHHVVMKELSCCILFWMDKKCLYPILATYLCSCQTLLVPDWQLKIISWTNNFKCFKL